MRNEFGMYSGESLMYFFRLLCLQRTAVTLVSLPRSIDLPARDWDLSLPVIGTRVCLLMRPSPPSSMSSQHAVDAAYVPYAFSRAWLYGRRPSSTAQMPACVSERLE